MTDPIAELSTPGVSCAFFHGRPYWSPDVRYSVIAQRSGTCCPAPCHARVCFPDSGIHALEVERKRLQTSTQEMQARRNAASKQIGNAKGPRRRCFASFAGSRQSWRRTQGSRSPARPDSRRLAAPVASDTQSAAQQRPDRQQRG